MDLNLNIHQF